jgi:prophage regulatory protein
MRILTFPQLKAEKGIPYCRDHLTRKEKAGEFPASIRLSNKRKGWIEAEIDNWIGGRIAERDGQ